MAVNGKPIGERQLPYRITQATRHRWTRLAL